MHPINFYLPLLLLALRAVALPERTERSQRVAWHTAVRLAATLVQVMPRPPLDVPDLHVAMARTPRSAAHVLSIRRMAC